MSNLLGLFLKPSGTKLNLKLTPNDDVGPFVVFVRKFTDVGATTEKVWIPKDLTSGKGADLQLDNGNTQGYHLLLDAHIPPGGEAVIMSELKFGKDQPIRKSIILLESEGPVARRRWSIVVAN